MREIISLHVGGAGNKIGARFFETLCAEHRVSTTDGTLLSSDRHLYSRANHHHAMASGAGVGAGESVEGAITTRGAMTKEHVVSIEEEVAPSGPSSFSFHPTTKHSTSPPLPKTPFVEGALHLTAAARVSRRALDVYFSEGKRGRWVPRSVLVDLEPSVLDNVRGGAMGNLFRPDGVVLSRGGRGGGNNWARGYHGEGAALVEEAMDAIRSEAEVREKEKQRHHFIYDTTVEDHCPQKRNRP